MQGGILQHWRVLVATLFSVVLIVGAYGIIHGFESPAVAQASAESALLKAIASKDSDGDGLPDWEESLYGTDPHKTDTFSLGVTDGEAVARGLIVPKAIADIGTASTTSSAGTRTIDGLTVPTEGSITDTFAKNFFTLYLAAKQKNDGADLSEAQMSDVANQALGSLASALAATPDFKSAKDIVTAGSGQDALKAYAVSAESILQKNTAHATTSELNYLTSAVQDGNQAAFVQIASIAKAYRDSAVGLAVLPAPAELVASHLALVNALMRVSQIVSDFDKVDTDTLATILALQQYPKAVLALGTAFIDIGKVYKSASITLPNGVPGSYFVNLMVNIANQQAKTNKQP